MKVGIDLVSIERVEKILNRTANFKTKNFAESELNYAKTRRSEAETLAGIFAAKEAFLKALGKGLGAINLTNIELLRQKSGQPCLSLTGKAQELAKEQGLKFAVSATHTEKYASVVVVAYREL